MDALKRIGSFSPETFEYMQHFLSVEQDPTISIRDHSTATAGRPFSSSPVFRLSMEGDDSGVETVSSMEVERFSCPLLHSHPVATCIRTGDIFAKYFCC